MASKYILAGGDAPPTLRESMKIGTKGCHDIADKLLEGVLFYKKMSVDCYKVYLSCVYYIYEALEAEMERNQEDPLVAPIYFPEIHRFESLAVDLEFYYGADWREKIECLPSVKAYADRLHEIGKDKPHLLAPHSYVRYFGDMSGGQILKKAITRRYNVPLDAPGTAFYDFTHLADIKAFKALYTDRLESLDLTPEQREEVVKEARVSFELNIDFLTVLDKLVDEDVARVKAAEEAKAAEAALDEVAKLTDEYYQKGLEPTKISGLSLRSLAVFGVSLAVFASAAYGTCPWINQGLAAPH